MTELFDNKYNGRLGNQLIRNLAVSLIAEKHNLKVEYSNKHLIEKLGIELFSGSNSYNIIKDLNDNNYFMIYNSDHLDYNLNANYRFFQIKEIITFLYKYLHTEKVKSNIINSNPFKERYNTNNDVVVHIRLTDVERFNPGIKYYLNAIKDIEFDNLYISTDDKHHNIITQILSLYPSAQIIDYDEITTFQFASTCKHIILSHGSFSAIIGYLAYYSSVYYPEYEPHKMWYGDVCCIDTWRRLSVN